MSARTHVRGLKDSLILLLVVSMFHLGLANAVCPKDTSDVIPQIRTQSVRDHAYVDIDSAIADAGGLRAAEQAIRAQIVADKRGLASASGDTADMIQDAITLNQFVLDAIVCRKGGRTRMKYLDVRYRNQPTRPLTNEEAIQLRGQLHWKPTKAVLIEGSSAQTELLDGKDQTLAVINISWKRTDRALPPMARTYYAIRLENHTNCVFSVDAELIADDGIGKVADFAIWQNWTVLHQPDRGKLQFLEVIGDRIPRVNWSTLVPAMTDSILSQCRTSDG
ncbi:hypothetical protein [Rudaea sp.]|uniref:hypothetical protein n=1 Tax=Rudaea sp. TaxID=2136325 RepID=UPI00321FB32A